jgi:hypothetical protein
MYSAINDLYKNINDLDKSNSLLKNLYMLPGFNITETNNSDTNCVSSTDSSKDNPVMKDSMFMKLLGFFDNTKPNQTQKVKPKLKLSKKQDKTFTRKQTQTQSHSQKQKQKQKQKLKTES